uniref:Kinesin light chain n=1 Tax=Neobodo designis TaxID=312471 RepID=A0A7S1L8T9_NEODS
MIRRTVAVCMRRAGPGAAMGKGFLAGPAPPATGMPVQPLVQHRGAKGLHGALGRVPPKPTDEEIESLELNKSAATHFEEGRYEQAAKAWSDALKKLADVGKDGDVIAVAPLNNLACAKGEMGDAQGKLRLLERALDIITKHYGTDHPQYVVAMSNLATALGDNGHPRQMLEMLQQALEVQRRLYKPGHAKIARTLMSIADAHARLGEFPKQLELLEEAFPMVKRHCGEHHPQVGITLNNLANAHGNNGDHYKRRDLLEEALEVEKKTLGPFHPQLAVTMVNLGDTEGQLGRPDKQRKYLEEAIALQTRHFGSSHPSMIIPVSNYAAVLLEAGEHVDARIQAEKAHSLASQYLNPAKDRMLAVAKTNLACALVPFKKQADAAAELAAEAERLLRAMGAGDDDNEVQRAKKIAAVAAGAEPSEGTAATSGGEDGK